MKVYREGRTVPLTRREVAAGPQFKACKVGRDADWKEPWFSIGIIVVGVVILVVVVAVARMAQLWVDLP